MGAVSRNKPYAVLTLANEVIRYDLQECVLAITDKVNADYGIDGYEDGYCGFGARLGRVYLGSGSLVTVSFAWDQRPKRTIIKLHGTNAPIAARWRQDMAQALREKFGDAVDSRQKK